MSVIVKVIDGKYRVTEEDTGNIAINKSGRALDGGGHSDVWKAIRQATHINVATEDSQDWKDKLYKAAYEKPKK